MTPREGATPTPMMLRLRPCETSPTSTATLPVPISTAAMRRLLLEITFGFALSGREGKTGRRGPREIGGRVLEPHRHLVAEGEVDGLHREVGCLLVQPVGHRVEERDLLEEIE